MENHFDQWCIVELFGHQRIAGRVSEQTIGGCSFVRVDVPGGKDRPAFTRLLGQGAIYSIIIADEVTARAAAAYYTPEPMDKWTVENMLEKARILPECRGGNDNELPY